MSWKITGSQYVSSLTHWKSRLSAHWLRDNPPEPGGIEEQVLQDPFDYAAEDRLLESWQRLSKELEMIEFNPQPGVGMAYSGPGGRQRSQQDYRE